MYWLVLNVTPSNDRINIDRGVVGLPRKEKVDVYYTVEKKAIDEAVKQASERQGQQFAIMKVDKVFETTKPKIITKVCNAAGELVVEPTK